MKSVFIALILSLLSWCLIGQQDHYQKFDRIIQSYQSGKTISYEMMYYYYDDIGENEASDSLKMSIIHRGEEIYMDMGEMEIIQLNGKNLTIYHHAKQMFLQDTEEASGFSLEQLKAYAEGLNLNLEHIKIDQQTERLRFTASSASRTVIELDYNPNTYYVKRTLLLIDVDERQNISAFNKTKLEAIYSKPQINKTNLPTNFSSYIIKQKGGYQVHTKYADYQLQIR